MEKRQHKKGLGILFKILAIVVLSLVFLAAVLTFQAARSLRAGMQEETKQGLRDLSGAVKVTYEGISTEPYSLADNGDLMKGDINVTQRTDIIDTFIVGSHVDITLFWGDTRKATTLIDKTTGERIVGTKADEKVCTAVLVKGEEYFVTGIPVNGDNYYGYYEPITDPNGEVVGMIFAGKSTSLIDEEIASRVRQFVITAIIILLVVVGVASVVIYRISSVIKVGADEVKKLADGDLNAHLPAKYEKRGDEIGAMAVAINTLSDELRQIIGSIKETAASVHKAGEEMEDAAVHTSSNADDISHAVEDIAKGAVSQAEDIENATSQVANMGNLIEKITNEMNEMNRSSGEMQEQGEQSVEIVNELSNANDKTVAAIRRIDEQVRNTDESVSKIREAVTLISSIADETNLLSLNASIEAARAGESGRGFAVVASQIQKLAEESNSSAVQIEEIITNLSEESRTSMKLMEDIQAIMSEQQQKLKATKQKFEQVNTGINVSKSQTETVAGMAKDCDDSRVLVVDVISDLSAISEENAASSEETNASMEELNATINILAGQAKGLKVLSDQLKEEIAFFKL